MQTKKLVKIISVAMISFLALTGKAQAEQCVTGVRALVDWATTKNIPTTRDAADSMAANARAKGFTVDNSASGCSSSKPCILVYPRNYGKGIDSTYGHVAVLISDRNSKGAVTITDSNGLCGGVRKTCTVTPRKWNLVSVIHPNK